MSDMTFLHFWMRDKQIHILQSWYFLAITTLLSSKKMSERLIQHQYCKPNISSTWYKKNVDNFSLYFIVFPNAPEVKVKINRTDIKTNKVGWVS